MIHAREMVALHWCVPFRGKVASITFKLEVFKSNSRKCLNLAFKLDFRFGFLFILAVSWGLGCKNASFPGVYSDIMYLTPWILKHMDKEGMSTDYFATQN
ncbi:unnamed protein product [Orchesella dallaii]|uniref:Peptidase S1 domain-containing protein n=1 Tax=Orchesella dallaii TaxID=48710 RepID=A0ABP1RG32_9HEXA